MSLPSQHFYLDIKIKNKKGILTNINDITLVRNNIQSVTIVEDILSLLPRIEIIINDVGGIVDLFSIVDNDSLKIIISQFEDGVPMVDMEFIISDISFDSDIGANNFNIVKIVGYAYSENLFVYKNRSFNNTSVDVLEAISKEIGTKFVNRYNKTTVDKMIWYQDSNNYNFIKHILERSFIINDGVFFYLDINNKFIYTTYNSELLKEQYFKANYNKKRVDNFTLSNDDSDVIFFDSYDVLNLSGLFNKMVNYSLSYGSCDIQGKYERVDIKNIKKLTQLGNRYKKYDGFPNDVHYVGIFDTANTHKDYHRGIFQNMYHKCNLFSNTVMLNINSMSNVNLFDKVNLGIPSILDENFNDVYSGYYLIGAITHNITFDGVYQKKILLCRHGINKSKMLNNYDVN